MITVRLYGHLGRQFGRQHRLDVRSPREAVRALCANFPGFRAHMLRHSEPGYHVRVGSEFRDETGFAYPAAEEIRIIPAVGGAGAVGRVILGATIMYLTMGQGAPLLSWAIGTGSSAIITGVAAAGNVGMALVMGGVGSLLFPAPKPQSVESPDNKPSYSFDGPVNTVSQGNPVPICYGRLIVGSQIVSAGLETGDIAP